MRLPCRWTCMPPSLLTDTVVACRGKRGRSRRRRDVDRRLIERPAGPRYQFSPAVVKMTLHCNERADAMPPWGRHVAGLAGTAEDPQKADGFTAAPKASPMCQEQP